jgi:DNA polymerase-3 subunit alpha
MGEMAHLHLHSSYSILDAISKIPDIVKRAREYGHKSIALTDHGTIAGVPEFYRECKKQGLKPIPASEFYMVPDAEAHKKAAADGTGKRYAYHLILLAMNDEGWKNIKLLTTQAAKQFYYVPRIDYKDLKAHSNGLIALTACLKGIVPHNLSQGNFDVAAEHAIKLRDIFGDRFYLETQDGGLDIQPQINEAMRALGQRLQIPIVGCQDAHYIDRNDVEAHEAIWAIRTYDTFDNPTEAKGGSRMYYATREYWLKDVEHMLREPLTTEKGHQRLSTLTEAEVYRSLEIADRIGNVTIDSTMHLPKYEFIPDIKLGRGCASKEHQHDSHCSHQLVEPPKEGETIDLTSFNYLTELVIKGYEERYKTNFFDASEEHRARLKHELEDIREARLADYFLIIWDIVSWAKSQDIPVGPGRGSAAGSMVAYCLGITGIEPLKYGLIWERFFNRGRIGSLADIDLDFSKRRREEVIEYIKKRFGEDRVAQMVTFNTLAPKAALKDTAKLLGKEGMNFEDANLMTRFVENKVDSIQDAVEKNDKLKEYEGKFPRLFKIAKTLEGCPKSSGKHAAGVIISDQPFSSGCIPLRWNTKEGEPITEFDGETLDKLGYLKVDVLGLSTMDVVHGIKNDVNRRYGGENIQKS